MRKALLIRANGVTAWIHPLDGKKFTLEELQGHVEGWIEILAMEGGLDMVLNENGIGEGLPVNVLASIMASDDKKCPMHILGDVVLGYREVDD